MGREGRTIDHDSAWGSHADAYAVLGVTSDADETEIVAAYRALARRHHPDLAGDGETAVMSRINAAFDLLRDRGRRDRYDRENRRPGWTSGPRPRPTTARSDPPTDPYRPKYGWVPEGDGTGGAGAPPGRPSGSVLGFGRHIGWSIGEIARVDPGYLAWLEGRVEGRPFLAEIDATLRRTGFRAGPDAPLTDAPRSRFRRFGWG